jgi:hypothetical protein
MPRPSTSGYYTLDGANLLYTTHLSNCSKFELGTVTLNGIDTKLVKGDDYRIKVSIMDMDDTHDSNTENNELTKEILIVESANPITNCPEGSTLSSGKCVPVKTPECTDTDTLSTEVEPYSVRGGNMFLKGTTCIGNLCWTDKTETDDCIGCTPKLIEYYCIHGTNAVLRMKREDCPASQVAKEGYCMKIAAQDAAEKNDENKLEYDQENSLESDKINEETESKNNEELIEEEGSVKEEQIPECSGCIIDAKCIEEGSVTGSKYCTGGNIYEQKKDGAACNNGYECLNGCSNNLCGKSKENLMVRIFNWFKGLFN